MNKPAKSLILTLIMFAGMLTSCNANSNKNETETSEMTEPTTVQPAANEDPDWKNKPGMYAEFNTDKGIIVTTLEYQKTPLTVANFVALVEGKMKNTAKAEGQPYYDGLKFHRVIANFMIQGGDPQGTGQGGPGYSFADEFDPSLRFDGPGILAMANAGPATNGSQFFITHVATTWLNDKHSIFGHVVQGQSVVNAIAQGDKMNTVRIIRVGDDAKKFDAVKTFETKSAELKKKQDEENKLVQMSADELVKAKYPTAKKTASGLYYVVEKEGNGTQAVAGKTVAVHYTGTLANGKKFDSSYDRNQPISFVLGQGQVIRGWDEGIALMKIGAKYKLIIPAALGYGANGAGGVIPPNATLIFDTELMEVK